jgi:hypothetical protein
MSKMQHGVTCHAVFQDLPFKIHVLTPTHTGRNRSQTWKVRLPLCADIFPYEQNIVIYFRGKVVQNLGKGLRDKPRSFKRHFA